MSEQDHPTRKPSAAKRFVGDVTHMPRWQKLLLLLAILACVGGVIGQIAAKGAAPAPGQTPADSPSALPENSRGIVSGGPQASPAAIPAPEKKSWLDDHSVGLTKSGASFVAAFVIGWAFRVFIKTMALVTAIAAAIFLALSYFNVIDIDFTAARQQYESASSWLTAQAGHLKGAAMAHLPASTTGVAGLFVGLWKK